MTLSDTTSPNLFMQTLNCLRECDVDKKVTLTQELKIHWDAGRLNRENNSGTDKLLIPGRPDKPLLVAPKDLSKRSAMSEEGKAALIHAICHIEFNAINLALDAVYRFRDMPDDYYSDWLKVATEEAYHFSLLAAHLQTLGYAYGDFVAHNGLWEMAIETDYDVLVRMALVPRVMEARGLDVTPSIMAKLEKAGDSRVVEILQIIQHDEVGHVEIGTRWYRYLCEQRNLPAFDTFIELVNKHMKGQLRGPFELDMRKQAGFSDEELAYLTRVG